MDQRIVGLLVESTLLFSFHCDIFESTIVDIDTHSAFGHSNTMAKGKYVALYIK